MLGFGVVMDVALIGMSVSVSAHGRGAQGPPAALLIGMALVTAAVLALLLRHLEPKH
jgi:hypothetical protein